jgi:flavin-dependent dehydrogenase
VTQRVDRALSTGLETEMFDVIVVGARCGGAPTAMLLARAGHRVLLVDRAAFPSDMRLSTHLLWPTGIARLARWGLLDALVASGCPPLEETTFDVGPFALRGRLPAVDGIREVYVPRRRALDALLVDAAVAAGVTLWERVSVAELIVDDGSVTGIRGRGPGGRIVTARAALVIGADGMRSRVAELVDAPVYHARPAVQGSYWSYWSGVPVDGGALYPRDGRTVYCFPTHDNLTLVGVNWRLDTWRRVRGDLAGEHLRAVADASPELAEMIIAGRREERWIGAATPGFFRTPYGPGWALVGDAGYTKDPCTAQGITDAWYQAELLAAAVHDALAGRRPMTTALADYQRTRDVAALPTYEFAWQTARMDPPSAEQVALFAALRGDPAGTERFFGLFSGSTPVHEFFGAADPAAA